jgi:hypothetical protein
MDLGPYVRNIVLTTDLKDVEPVTLAVTGTVLGDIEVGEGDDKTRGRIVFKTFPSRDGAFAAVPVRSTRPGLKLALESTTPSYLEANLRERMDKDGGVYWELSVRVPPNRVLGRLPADSAVVLKTATEPPRRIRIPVLGKATVSGS